ncbi:hypothetical protein ABZP36_034012 [Zizania latifolia]
MARQILSSSLFSSYYHPRVLCWVLDVLGFSYRLPPAISPSSEELTDLQVCTKVSSLLHEILKTYLKILQSKIQTTVMTCFPVLWRNKKSRSQIVQHDKAIPIVGNVKIFSSKELRRATKNFCSGHKLGQGSFGCVYMGKLRNGKKVAIKVLSSESRQGTREFLNELSVISNISHHNLVKLHGCCVEGDQKMLVYNYLENNSLAQSLFGKKNHFFNGFSNHGEFLKHLVHRTLNPRYHGILQAMPTAVWALYESGDLETVVDSTLRGAFDTEEAQQLLKIGLMCTQDTPKVRPSMATVVKMLKGEFIVGDKIMRPGRITDISELKVRTVEPVQFSVSPPRSPSDSNSQVSTLALAGSTVVEESP